MERQEAHLQVEVFMLSAVTKEVGSEYKGDLYMATTQRRVFTRIEECVIYIYHFNIESAV